MSARRDAAPPETGPGQASGRGAALIAMLGGLTALGPLSMDMYLPALPALGDDLAATDAQVQLTLTGCLVGLALGQLVAGPLSDAWGRRRPLLAGMIGYALASLACGLAPTVAALMALRFVQGLAGATGIVIARAIVRDTSSGAAAARGYSWLMLVTALAPVCAPLLGGGLLRVTTWRGIFVTLAAVGLLLLLTVGCWLRETLPRRRRVSPGVRATGAAFWGLATDRGFVGHTLPSGLAFGAMFAYISGSPFVLQDIHGLSPQAFGLVFGVNALGLTGATYLNARLVGWVAPRRLLQTGLGVITLAGLGLLAVTVTPGPGLPPLLAGLFLLVSSIGLIRPNATALALSRFPDSAGSASALLGSVQFVVAAATAPLVGAAGEATALPMAAVIAALATAAVTVFVACTREPKRRAASWN